MADQRSVFVPFDLDSGGGTEHVLGVNLRLTSSGGSVEALGSQVEALSIPVVIASDQTAVTVDTELLAAAALADNTVNPTVTSVGTYPHWFDGATWDRALGDATDGLLVNLGTNNDVSVTGSVDTELPAAAAMTDALANPTAPAVASHLVGWDRVNSDWTRIAGIVDGEVVGALNAGFLQIGSDGTNYQAITTDSAGHLQVDVLSGGGSPAAPTNPTNDSQTSASIAVATPTDIDGADDDNRNLAWIDIWSSVAWKGEIFTVDNAVESSRLGVTGGPAMTAVQWIPTHTSYIAVGATAGTDLFRVKFTNLDDNLAADAHVVFHYED